MSRSTCPDCNRWRCMCLAEEWGDQGEGLEVFDIEPAAPAAHTALPPTYVRTGPPSPAVRERLRRLRDEADERARKAFRTYGRAAA